MWRLKRALLNERGQMSVEFAVVIPVLLMVLVVVTDGLVYVGECARFDHIAAQEVLACGVTYQEGEYSQEQLCQSVQDALEDQFSSDQEQVEVSTSDQGWGIVSYECTLEMTPWPLSKGGTVVFGMKVPNHLEHSYTFAVHPYIVGALL